MSDFLKKLMDKAKDPFWDDEEQVQKPEPTEKNVVRRDSFDKLSWDMTVDQVPALRDQVVELGEEFPTSVAAYEDLFNMLHQGDPRFTQPEAMVHDYRPQHHMLQEMFSGDAFETMRKTTAYDEYSTIFTMLTLDDKMRESFEELKEAQEAIQQAMEAMQEAMEDAQEALDSGQGQDTAGDALVNAMAQMAGAQQGGQDVADQVAKALRQGLRDAQADLDHQAAMADGFGLEDGELQRMSFEERRALAERLDKNRLSKLANMIGAFRQYADAERRRRVQGGVSVKYDITTGNDLTKLVAEEFNKLAIPEMEEQFWIQYARHGLLQWEERGPENAGKGPIIVVCDESYSMTAELDDEGNTREAWSKAVALALCDQAKRGKRDFTYIGFASPNQQWEMSFAGGVAPIDKVITFTEHFLAGGTSYVEPLTRAMEIVREYEKRSKVKPDIVFITDDQCSVPEQFVTEWNELRERADVRCYGVQVGGGSGYENSMRSLVDRCMSIDRLNASPEAVQEIFRVL